ncbi:MAG: HAD-IB family hydrolase [Sedimenticola sp.]|uniref:Histidinol-phosphatase n=1 Tax=Sedimenticola thiotaurini TaxID=1543721 RepID=A0A558DBX4_9GAMM|nr:HAD-IB family hydrolase [Sedimenticola sp.]TVT58510.1 MAG: HAD family hydrolase [Sedimenticola thiotaurini]MCW8881557.1 HAD-IB family hydrolase [Sedimenticola sp.]MCW8919856.1 HAD-IB family hydrolase [Sedimenticola sp.]MCW8946142.1 HAD-IB family hydrolase [Sedimenticola sp.]
MPLAIFDLDNTLLNGDSDHLWGVFLAEKGIVDGAWYERENDRFYQEYKEGRLDIHEFLRFSLKPLSQHSVEQLQAWHHDFMQQKIEPILLPAARLLVERHRKAGDTLMIITATNAFVTAPIAAAFGIEHLIATDPEMIDGRYTGEVAGTPSFREGKVTRLNLWLKAHQQDLTGSSFYSDSQNDLPLLEQVECPVAVDPDETLAQIARERSWPIISLRE